MAVALPPLKCVCGLIKTRNGDFPGSPVAETLHPNIRGTGSIPGQGTRSCMPHSTAKKKKIIKPQIVSEH